MPRMGMRATLAALPHLIKEARELELYREYTARCLRVISENTAKACGGGCTYISAEYTDILADKQEDTRTAEEIVADVISRAGIEVRG